MSLKAKQYTTEKPMIQWRNQRGYQKMPWDDWKQKHNFPNSMGHKKNSSKWEVYSNIGITQKKQEKSQIWKT